MEFLSRLLTFLSDALVNIGVWIEGLLVSAGLGDPWVSLVMTIIRSVVVGLFPLVVVIFLIWAYRKLIARMQGRLGPNSSGTWAGPYGILQTFADAIKMLTKEDVAPKGIDRVPYNLAPFLVFVVALVVWAVIPFGPDLIGTDLSIGILYIMAFSSAALVIFLMAGWSSNNKYATVGAFRAVAQLIGYEIPQLLSVLTVILVTGSLSMQEIVQAQDVIFLISLPLPALVFFLAGMAEINARPFELLEAESELVCGYFVEYSGMKFGMFYLTEFMNTVAVSAIFTTLFLGGWRGPWVAQAPILGTIWFLLKMAFMVLIWMFFQMTLPRLRIDQMLDFNWKFLVPLALVNLSVVSIANKLLTEYVPNASAWSQAGVLLGANLAVALVLYGILYLVAPERRRRGELRAAEVRELEVSL
jgi:NADH-quinone oxidoreductase subunit H